MPDDVLCGDCGKVYKGRPIPRICTACGHNMSSDPPPPAPEATPAPDYDLVVRMGLTEAEEC